MRRLSSLIAMPLAAVALFTVSVAVAPAPEAAAQVPTPKPAGAPVTTTAPRAGGFPLEMAGMLVAGGSAVAASGLYALRRRKRDA